VSYQSEELKSSVAAKVGQAGQIWKCLSRNASVILVRVPTRAFSVLPPCSSWFCGAKNLAKNLHQRDRGELRAGI